MPRATKKNLGGKKPSKTRKNRKPLKKNKRKNIKKGGLFGLGENNYYETLKNFKEEGNVDVGKKYKKTLSIFLKEVDESKYFKEKHIVKEGQNDEDKFNAVVSHLKTNCVFQLRKGNCKEITRKPANVKNNFNDFKQEDNGINVKIHSHLGTAKMLIYSLGKHPELIIDQIEEAIINL
jgi:hypothetical protein